MSHNKDHVLISLKSELARIEKRIAQHLDSQTILYGTYVTRNVITSRQRVMEDLVKLRDEIDLEVQSRTESAVDVLVYRTHLYNAHDNSYCNTQYTIPSRDIKFYTFDRVEDEIDHYLGGEKWAFVDTSPETV